MPKVSPAAEAVPGLQALVVKDGVVLGRLGDAARALALGWVWAGLPRAPMSEAAVNGALREQLAGAARCLQTDHVELRRWLCDAGWVARDGFGRQYLRQAPEAVPEHCRAIATTLDRTFDGHDTAAWAAQCRAARQAERDARRLAHEARG